MSSPALSTPRTVWLVAEREIVTRLRSVAFLVSSAILLLLVLGGIIVGSIMSANEEDTRLAVVDGVALGQIAGVEAVPVEGREAAEELVRAGDVEAAAVLDETSPLGFALLGDSSVPSALLQALSVAPAIELLDDDAANPFLAYLVALGFGIVFFASAMTFGTTIAQSVVEEKSTRVIEILLAAIPTRALLAGKVLGTTLLAFGQIALVAATAIAGLALTGQHELLLGLGSAVVWFVVFFILGFVLLASLFAATGAMVSRQEDIGSTTTPVTLLVRVPYFLVVFFNDNPLVIGIMSYVPFSAPVGMPLRIFLGTAQWWEPLVSLAVLAATTFLVIALGARVYERSLLKLGARVSWREAVAG